MATNPTGGTSSSLVDRVKNIIVSPKTEWPVIDAEPSTIAGIYSTYVAILAAIPAIAFAVGMLLFGISLFFVTIRPPMTYVVTHAVINYVTALVGVYIIALIIEALAPTFGGVKDRVSAFKLAAYSYTPAWVAGILLLLPSLWPLVALVSLYCIYVFYVGLPVLMKSPADKTLGYFLAIVVAAIVIALVLGAVTNMVTRTVSPISPASSFSLQG